MQVVARHCQVEAADRGHDHPVGAVLGIAIALSTPKKYEAITELIVDPRDLKLADRDLTQIGRSPPMRRSPSSKTRSGC